MWTLAAETSTPAGSVSLFKGHELIQQISWEKEHSHSERITIEAQKLLADAKISFADIDQYAVGTGPGSFTGIRVAINFIRTLAFTFDKPVITANSLALMAAPALAQGLVVFCMQSAFRNFVYCAHYSPSAKEKEILAPSALTIDELESYISEPVLVIGRGFQLFENTLPESLKRKLSRDSRFLDVPLAKNFQFLQPFTRLDESSLVQQLRWNATKPLYIRASEAEEKLRQSLRK